jgi:hypothetical protein
VESLVPCQSRLKLIGLPSQQENPISCHPSFAESTKRKIAIQVGRGKGNENNNNNKIPPKPKKIF